MRFFADATHVEDVKDRIQEEVVPLVSSLDNFVGLVALKSGGSRVDGHDSRGDSGGGRVEIVMMSLWDDDLGSSQPVADTFRDEIERVTGAAPTRREFDVVRVLLRDREGSVHLDVGGD